MRDLGSKQLSLADIRETGLAGCLEKLGYQPAKIRKNGTDYWYLIAQGPSWNAAQTAQQVRGKTMRVRAW
jgi:hypothetical protein